MASVFVAGKVEECIRRARDIVNVFHHIYCLIRSLPSHPIEYVGDTYYIWRDRLCTTEALLLRELGFHVQPASPVGLLLSYMKILEISDYNTNFAQLALNYLNDALKSNAYVLFQPRIITVSAISLALNHLNLTETLLPPADSIKFPWFTLFDVNETELKDCSKIILTVYKREFDVLLPLTKEELNIFSSSIRPEVSKDQKQNEFEKEHVRERDYDYKNYLRPSKHHEQNSHSSSRDRSNSHHKDDQRYRHSSHGSYRESHSSRHCDH